MATNKRVFTLRLSDEVFDKIGALATREHRSITNYIEFVLLKHLEEVEKAEGTINVDNSPKGVYYAFFPTVDEAKLMGHEIVRRFEAAGIRVNKRKCKVIPLTKPFRFCKARFTLTETGKIKVNGSRDGVKRARRKLKLFHREFKEGKRSFFDIEQYMECQSAYYRNFNDHGRLLRLRRLYHAIFFGGGQCLESSKPGPVSA